jgi:hypothetical protein
VLVQRLDHHAGQANPSPSGGGLGRPQIQMAMHLGHHLGDLHHAGGQVQALAAQPGHLPDAQPPIGPEQDQRPIGRPDGHG